jgi:CheY-like chemotaxis protein
VKTWARLIAKSFRTRCAYRQVLAIFKRDQTRIFARIPNTRRMILDMRMDMRMPGMNGLELRRRAAASHREAPVISLSRRMVMRATLTANSPIREKEDESYSARVGPTLPQ